MKNINLICKFIFIVFVTIFFLVSCNSKKYATDQMDESTLLYTQIANDPTNDSLFFVRAQYYLDQENLDSAHLDIKTAIHLDSFNHPNYYLLLSDIQILNLNSRDALSTLTRAQEIFPDNLDCILRYAKLQLILKQHIPALMTLDKLYLVDPQNADAHYLAGHIFLDMEDTAKALSAFQRSVAFDPELKEGWAQLGDLAITLKDSIALKYYDNAIQLDSNDVESLHNKAYAYKIFDNLDKSIELHVQITKRFPEYEPSFYNLGLLYMEKDSFAKAIAQFNVSTSLNPQEASGFLQRGVCYEKLGNTILAKDDYIKAYLLDTQWVDVKNALQNLK